MLLVMTREEIAPLGLKKVGLSEIGTKFEQKKVDTYVCSEDMLFEF